MKCFPFYNLNILSTYDLAEVIALLDEELGSNKALKECPNYMINILPYGDYRSESIKDCIRVGYHPLNNVEIWQDPINARIIEKSSDEIFIRKGNSYTIFIRDTQDIYSYLRSKICEIIRDCMLRIYPFSLHAALIGYDRQLSLIIGAKSSGKTSSVLYALANGWDVYTDEFVLIDRGSIDVLVRFPAISREVEKRFFPDMKLRLHKIIKGYLTGEAKKIINIDIKECRDFTLSNINRVYILTDYRNQNMPDEYKKHILYSNFITGENISNDQYEIVQELILRSQMISIKDFTRILQEDKLCKIPY